MSYYNISRKFLKIIFIITVWSVCACSDEYEDDVSSDLKYYSKYIIINLLNNYGESKVNIFTDSTLVSDTLKTFPSDTLIFSAVPSIIGSVGKMSNYLRNTLDKLTSGTGGINNGLDLGIASTASYTSTDDSKYKTYTINENVDFESKTYSYCLTITDITEGNNIALKMYYNSDVNEGVILFKPFAFNQIVFPYNLYGSTVMRLDFSQDGNKYYNTITVTDLPQENIEESNIFYIKNIFLYIVEDYDNQRQEFAGIADFPDMWFDETINAGFSLVFTAAADFSGFIGIITGLTTDNSTQTSAKELLISNAAGKVLGTYFPIWNQKIKLNSGDTLTNDSRFENPGFFYYDSYTGCQKLPSDEYRTVKNIAEEYASSYTFPYSPAQVANLEITIETVSKGR